MDIEEKIKSGDSSEKPSQDKLGEFLDKAENSQDKGKLFIKSETKKKSKDKFKFKDIKWYVVMIRKPVLVLASIEILLYFFALVPNLKLLMLDVFNPLLLLVDFILFGWLFSQIVRHGKESYLQGLVTVFVAGFSLGLITSIFKAFWIRDSIEYLNILV